jgi:hypothetical protein
VSRQYFPAPRVDLYLPDHGHPGAFQAQVETADAGEQGQDVHGYSVCRFSQEAVLIR